MFYFQKAYKVINGRIDKDFNKHTYQYVHSPHSWCKPDNADKNQGVPKQC